MANPATGTASPITVDGLVNGTTYRPRVRARNAAGYGPWSDLGPAFTPRAFSPGLLPVNTATLETDVLGWEGSTSGTTVTRDTTVKFAGAASLAVARAAGDTTTVPRARMRPTQRLPALPGQRFTASCFATSSSTAGREVIIALEFQDATGTTRVQIVESAVAGSAPLAVAGQWIPLSITAIAPTGAATVSILVGAPGAGTTTTQTTYFDNFSLTTPNAPTRLTLGTLSTPGTQTQHSITVRARKTDAALTAALRVRLVEGSTVRSSLLDTGDLTTTFRDYVLPIADAESGTITNYGTLALDVLAYSSAGAAAGIQVAEVSLEIPTSVAATPSSDMFQGARVDGAWEQSAFAASTALDSPFDLYATGIDQTKTPTALYEAHQGKMMSAVHYGGSISAWPPANYDIKAADALKARGSFPYYGYATNGSAGGGQADILMAYTTNTDATSIAARDRARNYLGKLFQQMKDHAWPVLLRPWWEMNGGWFSWGRAATGSAGEDWSALGATGSAARDSNFILLWINTRKICVDVMTGPRDGVASATFGPAGTPLWGQANYTAPKATGNVAFHWAPNNFGTPGSVPSPQARWPGIDHVDWLGWQGYLFKNETYTLDALFGPIYNLCKQLAPTKPMAIGEYGFSDPNGYSSPYGSGTGKVALVKDWLETWLPAHPEVKCAMVYNEGGSAGDKYQNDYIETPAAALAQWKTSMALPRYLGAGLTKLVSGQPPYIP